MKTLLVTIGLLFIAVNVNAECRVKDVHDFLMNASAKAFEETCAHGTHLSLRMHHHIGYSSSGGKIIVTHNTWGERFGGILICKKGTWHQVRYQENLDDTHTYTLSCR
jgi:hypothetical protein